jgi:hypothetical protein
VPHSAELLLFTCPYTKVTWKFGPVCRSEWNAFIARYKELRFLSHCTRTIALHSSSDVRDTISYLVLRETGTIANLLALCLRHNFSIVRRGRSCFYIVRRKTFFFYFVRYNTEACGGAVIWGIMLQAMLRHLCPSCDISYKIRGS